jgi:hypothetical protein
MKNVLVTTKKCPEIFIDTRRNAGLTFSASI